MLMSVLNKFNLNHMTMFVAVIDAGSITAAAHQLGMSLPMVNTHLRKLESDLGVSLLNRTTHPASPTDAGRVFYNASRDVLGLVEQAIAVARGGEAAREI